jgi:hypothetical protein
MLLVGVACGGDDESSSSSGGGTSTGPGGSSSTGAGGTGGGTSTGGGGSSSGSGGGSTGPGYVYYSDYGGLYSVMEGSMPTQLMGDGMSDFKIILSLLASPDGSVVAFDHQGYLRVIDGATGDEVLAVQGYKPWGWIDGDTMLASTWISNNPTEFFTLDTDGTEGTHYEVGEDYCYPSTYSLSSDGTKFAAACGFGSGTLLAIVDLAGQSESTQATNIEQGKAPYWLGNDQIVWHGPINGSVYHAPVSDTSDQTEIMEPTTHLRPWVGNSLLAVGQTTGSGGMNINAFRSIDIPSGAVTDIQWLTDENPVAPQVHISDDETRVLFKRGNDVVANTIDGNNEVIIATGANIQSVDW